jgi:hypothetical protein
MRLTARLKRWTRTVFPHYWCPIEPISSRSCTTTFSRVLIRTEKLELNYTNSTCTVAYSMRLNHAHIWQRLTCYTGEGSLFKAHVDTPRGEKMFGSLVIVLPTPHECGALVFRHHGQEWTFDFFRRVDDRRANLNSLRCIFQRR